MKYLSEVLASRGHTVQFTDPADTDCIIIDALNVPKNIIERLRTRTKKLVLFDYNGAYGACADLRINALYPPKNPPDIMKVGYDYMLLNPVFSQLYPHNVRKEAVTILIAQGGGDTYRDIPKLIRKVISLAKGIKIILFQNVSEPWKLFPEIDIAITGGGMTVFELLCSGVPCLTTTNEPKEKPTLTSLTKLDVCKPFTDKNFTDLITDHTLRYYMSIQGRTLIDGKGCDRIVSLIEEEL
jgi:spore coat polysaccharide biosynthesis predicted glycosyltransferase SpsG